MNSQHTDAQNVDNDKWKNRFNELQQFKLKHGHCRVPFKCTEYVKLGQWVATQRTQHRYLTEDKPSNMTNERRKLLDDVGFSWNTNNTWGSRYDELKKFKDVHGHCKVPYRFKDNPELGKWVSRQRQNYKYLMEGKPSKISEERVQTLEEIGFDWIIDRQKKSERPAVEKEPYSNSTSSNGSRKRKLNRVLQPIKNIEAPPPPEKQQQQQQLTKDKWQQRCDELQQFKSLHGHCKVPSRYIENPELGRWVSHQRHSYKLFNDGKPAKISNERIKVLNDLGFDWFVGPQGGKINDRTWNVHFDSLKRFKARYGHCKVPHGYGDDPKLASWVSRQRQNYKLLQSGKVSKMTEERQQALEDIGFIWDVRTEPTKDCYYLIDSSVR